MNQQYSEALEASPPHKVVRTRRPVRPLGGGVQKNAVGRPISSHKENGMSVIDDLRELDAVGTLFDTDASIHECADLKGRINSKGGIGIKTLFDTDASIHECADLEGRINSKGGIGIKTLEERMLCQTGRTKRENTLLRTPRSTSFSIDGRQFILKSLKEDRRIY